MTTRAQQLSRRLDRIEAERNAPIGDPNLRAALDEIGAILKRRRIAGDVMLTMPSQTRGASHEMGRKISRLITCSGRAIAGACTTSRS